MAFLSKASSKWTKLQKKETMSNNKGMLEPPLKSESVHDLLRVEDQLRVDDEMLTAKLPGRQSSRNRVIYNPTSNACLPGRLTSRNRTVFKKDIANLPPRSSTACTAEIEAVRAKQDSQQSADLRRTNTVV